MKKERLNVIFSSTDVHVKILMLVVNPSPPSPKHIFQAERKWWRTSHSIVEFQVSLIDQVSSDGVSGVAGHPTTVKLSTLAWWLSHSPSFFHFFSVHTLHIAEHQALLRVRMQKSFLIYIYLLLLFFFLPAGPFTLFFFRFVVVAVVLDCYPVQAQGGQGAGLPRSQAQRVC
jgi:hypothetical protein